MERGVVLSPREENLPWTGGIRVFVSVNTVPGDESEPAVARLGHRSTPARLTKDCEDEALPIIHAISPPPCDLARIPEEAWCQFHIWKQLVELQIELRDGGDQRIADRQRF